MKFLSFFFILLVPTMAFSQQTERKVTISCYVNSELYLRAGVVSFVTGKTGNPDCKGNFITFYNGGANAFYYKLSSQGGSWTSVGAKKRVTVGLARESIKKSSAGLSVVAVNVKYSADPNSDIAAKLKSIAKMNASSDKAMAGVTGGAIRSGGTADGDAELAAIMKRQELSDRSKIPSAAPGQSLKPTPVPAAAAAKAAGARETAAGAAARSRKKLKEEKDLPNDQPERPKLPACFYTADTAYYTFYYLKLGDTVLYSEPFAVEHYQDEASGQSLLAEAWNCFTSRLKTVLGEERYNQLISDDVNTDLTIGFLHLRDPYIPSLTIVAEYPYTTSAAATRQELKKWIEYDRVRNAGLKFLKVNFP